MTDTSAPVEKPHRNRDGAPLMLSQTRKYLDADTVCAALLVILFSVYVLAFQYRGVLGEADLYRVLDGILDGAVTGSRLDSGLHYGKDFSFGYLWALYAFVPTGVLSNPDKLIQLINDIGFFFTTVGLFFFWLSVRLVHGSRVATIALALFAFSPLLLELATSGHQILVAFSLLSAATACLFWRASGWRAGLAALAGTILLIGGLCVRADIFLALPYVVLTRVNLSSRQSFSRSVIRNALAPTAAFIVFFALRHYTAFAPHETSESGLGFFGKFPQLFAEFYRWANVVPGFVYMTLGCGIATVILGVGVVVLLTVRNVWVGPTPDWMNTLGQLMGPISLIVVPFVFWLPNPQPSRHFLLVLAGLSILIGWAIGKLLTFRFVPALVSVLIIVAANQALSEGVRPALLRMNATRSPYRPPPEPYNTFNHAPLGLAWRHHATLESRLLRWKALGDTVATSCDANIVIFSDEPEQIFSRLYASGTSIKANAVCATDNREVSCNHAPLYRGGTRIDGFRAFRATRGPRRFTFIYKTSGWPKDAVATILADSNFDGYQLYADAYLPSVYDKTAIPVDRLAKFGCDLPRP
jgi:hypothetical protein